MKQENKGLVTLSFIAALALMGAGAWGTYKLYDMQQMWETAPWGLLVIIVPLFLLGLLLLVLSIRGAVKASRRPSYKRKFHPGRLLTVLVGAAMLVGFAMLKGAASLFGCLAAIPVLFVGLFWNKLVLPIQRNRAMKVTETYAVYDDDTRTLTMKQRGEKLKKVLQVEKDLQMVIKDYPVTLHIGAVSVGGVTTGGAYTTGGGQVIDSLKESGLFFLVYDPRDREKYHVIDYIRLDEKLAAQAKNSPVSVRLTQDGSSLHVGCSDLETVTAILEWMTAAN